MRRIHCTSRFTLRRHPFHPIIADQRPKSIGKRFIAHRHRHGRQRYGAGGSFKNSTVAYHCGQQTGAPYRMVGQQSVLFRFRTAGQAPQYVGLHQHQRQIVIQITQAESGV